MLKAATLYPKQLTSEIRSSLDGGEVLLYAFLGFKGAFDNTSHKCVSRTLEKICVAAPVRRWIEAVRRTRLAETTVSGTRIRLGPTRGCPRGGVIFPLLWSLVVDDRLELLTINGYTDDIVILVRSKFIDTRCDIVQRLLGLTKGW